jgi:hypothetical protein
MQKLIQTLCLKAYRAAAASRLSRTRIGKRLFLSLYDLYKERFEAKMRKRCALGLAPEPP